MSWKNKYMLVYTHRNIPAQPPELEYGNTEYKIFLAPRVKKRNRNDPKLHSIYLRNAFRWGNLVRSPQIVI